MRKPVLDIDEYIGELRKQSRFLSRDEEQELAKRAKAGDKAARETLVLSILPLAVSVARYYFHRGLARGISMADLVQLGNIGVVRAVDKFDYTRGFRLTTYATLWIKLEIRRQISHGGEHLIRKPPNAEWLHPMASLDREQTYLQDNKDEYPILANMLADKRAIEPSAELEDREEQQARDAIARRLHETIGTLPAREAEIVTRRLHGEGLKDIGERLGLSKERVRQIELRAMHLLREALGAEPKRTSMWRLGLGRKTGKGATNPA